MRQFTLVIAALAALAWSGAAWAITDTTITVTDEQGQPLKEAKVTLERVEKTQKTGKTEKTEPKQAPRPKTPATNDKGELTITHEDGDKTSDDRIIVTVTTKEGKTLTVRTTFKELLSGGKLVVIESSVRMAAKKKKKDTGPSSSTQLMQSGNVDGSSVTLRMIERLTRIYAGASVGGSNNCTTQTFTGITTLFGADAFNPAARNNCNGSFVAGGSVGFDVAAPALPNPFVAFKVSQAWGRFDGPPPPRVGVNVDVLGVSGGTSTFLGTPTTTLGVLPGTDSYNAHDNFYVILSGTANFPIMPGVDLLTHAGYGWANKTVTYNCVGLCTLAGTPQFSTSKDITLGGPAVGGGLQFAVPQVGFPLFIQFDYNHLFLNDRTVQFGNPATVFVNFKVNQDVDIFTAKAVVPFNTSSFWAQGINFDTNFRY